MRGTVTAAAAAAVMGLGALAGCTADTPSEAEKDFTLDACSLVDATTVEALIGDIKETNETSVDLNGPESNWAQCRYIPADTPKAALQVHVEHGTPKEVAFVETGADQCRERLPLDVEGAVGYLCGDPTGDGLTAPYARAVCGENPVYYASLSLSPRDYAPTLPEAAAPLRETVRDLMRNVDESSFVPDCGHCFTSPTLDALGPGYVRRTDGRTQTRVVLPDRLVFLTLFGKDGTDDAVVATAVDLIENARGNLTARETPTPG